MTQTIAITGATGTLGRPLAEALLDRGDRVIALVRDPAAANLPPAVEVRRWTASDPAAPLDGADAVVNLAGAPIAARRWTAARRRAITASRVDGTRSVVAGMARAGSVRALVSASAIEYSGARGEAGFDETTPPGAGFLPELTRAWEEAAERALALGARVVLLRKGVVLAPAGGMLATLLPFFQRGLGVTLGSGRQWLPWLHLADDIGLMLLALDRDDVRGPLVCAAPNPVRFRAFARTLGQVLGRPPRLRVPTWALRLALGETAQVVTASHRPQVGRALGLGYEFRFPLLGAALADLVGE